MRVDFKVVTGQDVLNENPSPSGDPFFDNPKNVKEILRRKKGIETGKVKSTPFPEEIFSKLLDRV